MKVRAVLALAFAAGSVAVGALSAPASAACPPLTEGRPIYHPLTGKPIATYCVPDLPECYPGCDVAKVD